MKHFPFFFSRCIFAAALGGVLAVTGHADTYVVTTTADSGTGSLRQAILDANARIGADTIGFGIPGDGPHTIAPLTALPSISDPVVMDGYTQSGASANTLSNGNNTVLLVELDGSNLSNYESGLVVANPGNSTVRGLVIHSFAGSGVYLLSANNLVQGNFIGTDVAGVTALPNGSGVGVLSYSGNLIGGAETGDGNVISGNLGHGIALAGVTLRNTEIKGNFIGTDKTGTIALGNQGSGVSVFDPSNIVIGDDGPNVIAYNGIGITVDRSSSAGIAMLSNSIHSNTGFGIRLDFGGGGVNDECDDDTGANKRQNFPVLASAVSSDCATTIKGVLESAQSTEYRIQFFASPECDSSGYGEGEVFIGETPVVLDAFCSKKFSATLQVALWTGWVVAATATDPEGNTSQFSECITVQAGAFADSIALGGGWMWLDWFGSYNTEFDPWIYHQEHGFLFRLESGSCSERLLFLYDNTMRAWWWTAPDSYPHLFRFSDDAWLFYDRGSVGPRWFYNYKTAVWESW